MISHAHLPFTFPCLRPCLPPVPNLWLLLLLFQIAWVFGFIMATRGATMMIVEIDSPTFPVITFITRGKSRKMKVSQSPLEESRKRPGLRPTRFKQIFCSSRKDSSYRKCSIALFIVASMSAWFDNRCLSPSISHPPRSTPPRFSDVQLNSLPNYRRALLSERLEQAIEKSCPLQMMTVQVEGVFLNFSIKYLPNIVNPLSPPPPTTFSNKPLL